LPSAPGPSIIGLTVTSSTRQERIAQLVRESLYEVDPALVAEAIVARLLVARLVPEVRFRNEGGAAPEPQTVDVRSFRPSTRVRSFHLERRPGSVPRH